MRNISLIGGLTIGSLLVLGLPSSAQQKMPEGCTAVRGQIICPPTQQSNGCMQNPKFNILFPVTPISLFKEGYPVPPPPQPPRNIRGDDINCMTSSPNPKFCARIHVYESARLSDVYLTNSNEVVKAFWNTTYRLDQKMYGLLGKGQTTYPGTHHLPDGSAYPGWVMGQTYPVGSREFDCFTYLTDSEKALLANVLRGLASPGSTVSKNYRINGNLFQPLRPYQWID